MSMYKIGVIGDRDSVLGFRALGVSVFPVADAESAKRTLRDIVKEGFACIFLTEALAANMGEELERFSREPLPAILLIPNNAGSLGIAMRKMKAAVERAVGADILFQEEVGKQL
ncbi:MAG TPA: V-type ATP synthase subunit F [Firmicutes bacterium]|nr:V-type ATP synthase subunit F [Bacillota bacterium]